MQLCDKSKTILVIPYLSPGTLEGTYVARARARPSHETMISYFCGFNFELDKDEDESESSTDSVNDDLIPQDLKIDSNFTVQICSKFVKKFAPERFDNGSGNFVTCI